MIKEIKNVAYHSTLLNEDFKTPEAAKVAELHARIHIRKNIESLIDMAEYYNDLCDEYDAAKRNCNPEVLNRYEQMLDEAFNEFYEVGVHKLLFPENADAATAEIEKEFNERCNEEVADANGSVEDIDVERAPSGGVLVKVHKVRKSHCDACKRCKQ